MTSSLSSQPLSILSAAPLGVWLTFLLSSVARRWWLFVLGCSGYDPHDDSDFLTIHDNIVYDNFWHGIIASKRCNNVSIQVRYGSHTPTRRISRN